MNFFCRENDFDTWVLEKNIDNSIYFKLNVYDALIAAKMIFKVD